VLNLVIDADYDGNSVLAKVRVGLHGSGYETPRYEDSSRKPEPH
jgi:hypothetical protein